ncbi:MAG: DNA methyltransferase [Planctomycetota bacterium]|nr:DNA methyltransferase [Planctomycetota bacterium]MDA1262753.1 DNA methyltransferase [Planctomycetota bacterium]
MGRWTRYVDSGGSVAFVRRPTLRIQTTTLWEYPSQHYDAADGSRMQGDKNYVGATPSWVIWQLLKRYTREGDTILDPMCGSGTTLDVCADVGRKGLGFDLVPTRPDIAQADARKIPLADSSVDFAFIDPPYSTHVDYSDDPRCIGKLDASGDDGGKEYYAAMDIVLKELHRTLKDRRYMALYVSDSWRKRRGEKGSGNGIFMPIGFELFARLRKRFQPVDVISVVRHNASLGKGNFNKAAEEGNFFLRGFNYLFIMKKVDEVATRQGR